MTNFTTETRLMSNSDNNAALSTQVNAPGDETLEKVYQPLLASLTWQSQEGKSALHTLGVVGTNRGEGVSTVAANLAVAAARTGARRILLVDANVDNPTLHEWFRLQRGPGLAEAVLEEVSPRTCLQRSDAHNLSLLAAGNAWGNRTRVFDMNIRLVRVVAELAQIFDLIVFDTPALAACGSTLGFLRILDGVALVVEAEGARWQTVRRSRDSLLQSGVRLAGAVLNKRRDYVPDWLYRLV